MCAPLRRLRLPVVRGMLCARDEPSGCSSHHKDCESVLSYPSRCRGLISSCPYIFNFMLRRHRCMSNRIHLSRAGAHLNHRNYSAHASRRSLDSLLLIAPTIGVTGFRIAPNKGMLGLWELCSGN